MPGTRDWLLKAFDRWLTGDDDMSNLQRRAFVLVAGPGVGKSAFSALLCTVRPQALAAHHFCRAGDAERSSPHRMLCSLAYQLACHLPAKARDDFKSKARSLAGELAVNGRKVTAMPLHHLFNKLLKDVLWNVDQELVPGGQVCIAIVWFRRTSIHVVRVARLPYFPMRHVFNAWHQCLYCVLRSLKCVLKLY